MRKFPCSKQSNLLFSPLTTERRVGRTLPLSAAQSLGTLRAPSQRPGAAAQRAGWNTDPLHSSPPRARYPTNNQANQ